MSETSLIYQDYTGVSSNIPLQIHCNNIFKQCEIKTKVEFMKKSASMGFYSYYCTEPYK